MRQEERSSGERGGDAAGSMESNPSPVYCTILSKSAIAQPGVLNLKNKNKNQETVFHDV